MHRVLFALYRKEGLAADEFAAHYRDVHIPISRRFPGLREYDVFLVADPGEGPDAFAVMAFDSAEDFQAALDTDEFREAMADSETFTGCADSFVVEHVPALVSA